MIDLKIYQSVVDFVRRHNRASTSHIQRTFYLSYSRADEIMEKMEKEHVVSPMYASGRRDVYPEIVANLYLEIGQLKAKLEQLEQVWIDVKFLLPDEGEKVLIMIGDEQTVAEKCNVFGFIDVIDREALRTDLITYWMPLPKPPVKEGD
ncbi:DNA translocase FtsK [Acinetobacter soli]|uniref:DNA translocase FtsK n=1 Tax=Acinetobacter soli TaxID=487316 RepID=UPI00148F3146|nr:DNA translocase FtsK [Acinetobacter soli]